MMALLLVTTISGGLVLYHPHLIKGELQHTKWATGSFFSILSRVAVPELLPPTVLHQVTDVVIRLPPQVPTVAVLL